MMTFVCLRLKHNIVEDEYNGNDVPEIMRTVSCLYFLFR